MEGIAADAKVGKQTIYRWWPSRSALVAECLVEGLLLPDQLVPADSGDLRADTRAWLDNLVRFVRAPGNADLVRSLLVAGAENPQVADRFNDRIGMFTMLDERFTAAIGSGQLAAIAPVTVIGEAMVGALVLRALRRGEFGDDFAGQIVDALLPRAEPARQESGPVSR